MTGAETSLAALLGASFFASTLLPVSSEAALFAVLKLDGGLLWPALGVATLGNTAGGWRRLLLCGGLGSYELGFCLCATSRGNIISSTPPPILGSIRKADLIREQAGRQRYAVNV